MSEDPKKIIVDEDWKSKAAAEKAAAEQARKSEAAGESDTTANQETATPDQEQSTESEIEPTTDSATQSQSQQTPPQQQPTREETSSAGAGPSRAMPPAKFDTLVSTLAMQAASAMGLLRMEGAPDMPVDMDIARHMIDLLEVLAAKTKGNLTGEEHKALQDTLHQLRLAYVSMSSSPSPESTTE